MERGLSELDSGDGALWVGHATYLLRIAGFHILTDPVWSDRVSPIRWVGPKRFQPPAIPLESLPRLDAVLISHDHYDHLDRSTVRALARGAWAGARWFAPLGHADWLRKQGVRTASELDWWEQETLVGPGGRRLTLTAIPAQHWTRRDPWSTNKRLWCGWVAEATGPAGVRRVCFVGDSGYFTGFQAIGDRLGPFDLTLMPIGAYEPRWFMKFAHMNPEEAVAAYRDLGGQGLMAPMHWGTFRLTDEDPREPPLRAQLAWAAAGLPKEHLRILKHGEVALL